MAMPKFPKLPNDPTGISTEDVDLFLNVFRGRRDVVAELWKSEKTGKTGYQPICFNEWKPDLCRKPCRSCPNAKYRSLDDPLIRKHLAGITVLGIYPLLEDNTCWFVAGDFDNHDGARDPLTDIRNFYETCAVNGITAYVFASKSGKGYHVYWFFSKPIEAWKARRLYHAMLIEAGILDEDHQLDNSFDRIFPNQDRLTGKGFGNLIAYPLIDIQHNSGKSLMLDPETAFEKPFTNQFQQLRGIERVEEAFVDSLVTAWKLKPSKPMKKNTSGSTRSTTGRRPAAGAGAGAGSDSEMESLIDRALSGDIKKGERDETIFKIACRLRGKGLSKREAEFFCCSLVDRCCEQVSDDPYTHADAVAKVDSAWRYEPNDDADEAEDTGADPSLPTICAQKYQLPTVVRQAWEALMAKNDPPVLFKVGDKIASIQKTDYGNQPTVIHMDAKRIRLCLSNVANWDKVVKKIVFPDRPPLDVCESLLVDPDNPLPPLDRIVTAPFFAGDGNLHMTHGYSAVSRCYLSTDIDVGTIPSAPSDAEVAEARSVVLDTLVDFPFTGDADRAHAISLMLLPFIRRMVDGPTPMHLFEAPMPRTGKSLLVAVCLAPFLGDRPKSIGEGYNPEELEKVLLATLQELPSYVFFDNVADKFAGAAIARALTEPYWRGRILRKSEMVGFPIHCAWAMTANNPRASKEIAGRTIRIRLDAGCANPGRRRTSDFRHPDIIRYIQERRVVIVRSCLLLIQNWIAKGKPSPAHDTPSFGSFEKWRDVMGGILAVNGIPGFLGNVRDLDGNVDEESLADEQFVTAWWERFDETAVSTNALLDEVNSKIDEPLIEGSSSDHGARTKMGLYLRRLHEQVFEIEEQQNRRTTVRVEKIGRKGHPFWRLKLVNIII